MLVGGMIGHRYGGADQVQSRLLRPPLRGHDSRITRISIRHNRLGRVAHLSFANIGRLALNPRFIHLKLARALQEHQLARLGKQRKLGFGIASGVGKPCRIVARKAVVGILRPRGIAAFLAQRPVDAIDR